MALKPDRNYTVGTDISFFMNEVGEKGEVLVFSTGGSGAAMDDASAVVTSPSADASGEIVAGILLTDVVNKDLTRTHINWQKDETQLGGKVPLLRQGVIVTDMIESGATPTVGAPAYFFGDVRTLAEDPEGIFSTTEVTDYGAVAVNAPSTSEAAPRYRVGTFLSTKDSDGYAKIQVNIQ